MLFKITKLFVPDTTAAACTVHKGYPLGVLRLNICLVMQHNTDNEQGNFWFAQGKKQPLKIERLWSYIHKMLCKALLYSICNKSEEWRGICILLNSFKRLIVGQPVALATL